MSKILNDIRTLCVGNDEDTAFDVELKIHANTCFGILHQLGVGPETKFKIVTGNETWDEFTGPGADKDLVQDFVILKTKSLFDPSPNANVANAADALIDELTTRLKWSAELEAL